METKNILENETDNTPEEQEDKEVSTSKKFMTYLFINCTLIEIFVAIVTIWNLVIAATNGVTLDFTPLVTLVGAIVGEVTGYAVYCLKAAKENTEGGIVYELTMKEQESEGIEDE